MDVAPTTLYGMIIVIAGIAFSHIGQWIREGRKHRDFKKKNDQLGSIEKKINTVDEKQDKQTAKIAGMTSAIKGMQKQCAERIKTCTTSRTEMEGRVKQNTDNLFKLAKNNKK